MRDREAEVRKVTADLDAILRELQAAVDGLNGILIGPGPADGGPDQEGAPAP